MAIRTGLEPATSSVTGWHSNQLNYRTVLRNNEQIAICLPTLENHIIYSLSTTVR